MSKSSTRLRRPRISDIPVIQDIAEDYDFPLPDKFEAAAVVECQGNVVAFGVLRTDAEAILYCKGTVREKSKSLIKLMAKAIEDAKALGHNDIYLFAWDEKFADILVKHFGFRRAKGIPLILDLERKDG
jgi:hypothetical protein